MGKIKPVLPAKYFCGLTFRPDVDAETLIGQIEKRFGQVDARTDIFNFSAFTDYYQAEMGKDLKKIFLSFAELHSQDYLMRFKLATNAFEAEFMSGDVRQFNMDPGYLTLAKVVLATTKDYSHRLYLGEGIYGDLHLSYSQKSYRPQPWTYPDYKRERTIRFFQKLREIYRRQLEFHLSSSENT